MHILLVAFIMRYILPATKGGKKIEENNKKVLPLGPLLLHLEVPCTPPSRSHVRRPIEVPCAPPLQVCAPPLKIPSAPLLVPHSRRKICLGEDPFDICILGFGSTKLTAKKISQQK